LLLLAAAAVVLAEGEGEEEKRGVRLLDAGRLEKFVDGLPDMPVLSGYGVADGGRLVPSELTVGMYDTTWVRVQSLTFPSLFSSTLCGTHRLSSMYVSPLRGSSAWVPAPAAAPSSAGPRSSCRRGNCHRSAVSVSSPVFA
jgi:hypothetical protein